jgi:hypothetical protein
MNELLCGRCWWAATCLGVWVPTIVCVWTYTGSVKFATSYACDLHKTIAVYMGKTDVASLNIHVQSRCCRRMRVYNLQLIFDDASWERKQQQASSRLESALVSQRGNKVRHPSAMTNPRQGATRRCIRLNACHAASGSIRKRDCGFIAIGVGRNEDVGV